MIKERVARILEFKGIPKEEFYSGLGMTSASFRGAARNTPLNSNAVAKILSLIPDLNPMWLLTGEGDMVIGEDSSSVAETQQKSEKPESPIQPEILQIEEKFKALNRELDDKNRKILELMQTLSAKERQIDALQHTLRVRERHIEALRHAFGTKGAGLGRFRQLIKAHQQRGEDPKLIVPFSGFPGTTVKISPEEGQAAIDIVMGATRPKTPPVVVPTKKQKGKETHKDA